MKMFAFVVCSLLVVAVSADEFCYTDTVRACSTPSNKQEPIALANCNAKYGAINELERDLQEYANSHITRSFDFLLLSTHYANYEKNRPGFEKLFRGLSDSAWKDAFELIKYIGKRGGKMNFRIHNSEVIQSSANFELFELESLAKALDIEKQLATNAHNIHRGATRSRPEFHDPEISSFIENHFVHRQAETIRKLSGFTADLQHLFNTTDSSLSLYLFDEYLQK